MHGSGHGDVGEPRRGAMAAVNRYMLSALLAVAFAARAAASVPLVTPAKHISVVGLHERPTANSRITGWLRPGERLQSAGTYSGRAAGWRAVYLRDRNGGLAYARDNELRDVKPEEIAFEVHFVDVGNGDAAVVNVGTTDIVIDGGGDPEFLRRYLRSRNLPHGPVELVVLSHAEIDHFAGLSALFGGKRRVLQYWDPGFDPPAMPMYGHFVKGLGHTPRRRPLWPCGWAPATPERVILPFAPEVEIFILHANACPDASESLDVRTNRSSIVMLLDIAGSRFLFTGDMLSKSRTEIAAVHAGQDEARVTAAVKLLRPVNVLKVPHHGSDTSSTLDFIDAVKPDFAVISANPKYHLPDAEVVARYTDLVPVVLRTDVDRHRGNDHILCRKRAYGLLNCSYEDLMNE